VRSPATPRNDSDLRQAPCIHLGAQRASPAARRAASSPDAAKAWKQIRYKTLTAMKLFAADLAETGQLRITTAQAGDLLWTYFAAELYELLVLERRWSTTRYGDFLARAFTKALLLVSGEAVVVMLSTVYVVWAVFLFHSGRAPRAHRLFLDFNLTANSAHFGARLIMALTMPDEHQHTAGVLAVGLISTVPLAACWLPVRRAAPETITPAATTRS